MKVNKNISSYVLLLIMIHIENCIQSHRARSTAKESVDIYKSSLMSNDAIKRKMLDIICIAARMKA